MSVDKAAIVTKRDLLVLLLAHGLLVDLLPDPRCVQAQLLELIVGQLPGSYLWLLVPLHECCRVKGWLQFRQFVLLYREEYIVLLG